MTNEQTIPYPTGPRSVDDLLSIYDEMVVPHFQRGLVWEESSVSLLLESLYFETPCGSIILWTPTNPSEEGEPLGDNPKYLIVDGQQRIRSLKNAFENETNGSTTYIDGKEEESDPDTENGDDIETDEQTAIWCLNLGRLRELESEFPGGKRFRLFRRTKDPRKIPKTPFKDREALLPLRWFLDQTDEQISELLENDSDSILKKASKAVLENDIVKNRLRNMRHAPLFYVATRDAAYRLEDVVGIYNRINTAGKRVESEEKAFANLVSAYPGINKKLDEFFTQVRGTDSSASTREKQSHELSRDNLLRRQKENRFGFKLFMRTFAQVLAYHSGRAVGASIFSFESVNAETIGDEKTRNHLSHLIGKTEDILVYLACVLREELHCDDFRMLPETSSFWPVIQLLIRFPGMMPAGKKTTASLLLRLLLADKQKKHLLKLASRVNEAHHLEEALSVFESDGDLTPSKIKQAITIGIKNSDSMMNRYALILYWLLRSCSARDFSYDNISDSEKRTEITEFFHGKQEGKEALLCEAVQAEKQHILPYKRLKMIFNLEGKARPGRHEAHNIGNITYISHRLNSYKSGIGSDPLKLELEPAENLKSHLMMDPKGSLLKAYNASCSYTNPDEQIDFKRAKRYFGQFSKKRRELIKEAFLQWEESIRNCGAVDEFVDKWPAKRLIKPTIEDDILDLGYPSHVQSALVILRNMRGMVKSRKLGAEISFGFRRKVDKKTKVQIIRVDLYKNSKEIYLKFGDTDLEKWFCISYQIIPLKDGRYKLDTEQDGIVQVINSILGKLSKIVDKDT